MTKGILIFAHDSDDIKYTSFAAWSAKRIHRHLDIPVSLVTDRPLDIDHDFDQVITHHAGSNGFRHKTPWRNLDRFRAGEFSPYDQTILLDADYVVCSDQLSRLFDQQHDILSMRWAYDVTSRRDYSDLNFFGRHQMPSAWATVIYWKRSKAADLVFGMMEMIQINWQHYLELYGINDRKFRNDYALAIASNTVMGHTGSWPSIPWSLATVEDGCKLSQIDQDRFEVRYPDRHQKSKRVLLSDVDFHAMGKTQLGDIVGS